MGWGLTHFFVHRAGLKRDARYLAHRLAIIMEKFAVDCADVIADNDLHRSSEGYAGRQVLKLPEITPLPADADWKALEPSLVDRAMSLPNKLALADAAISFWRTLLTTKIACGLKPTCKQGNRVSRRGNWLRTSRRRYGIPPTSLTEGGWNFVETLKEKHAAAEAKRRQRPNATEPEHGPRRG